MDILFTCPHCNEQFIVNKEDINCRIVRHFIFKNGEPLNPHAPQEDCARVVREDLGYGCAKPSVLSYEGNNWVAKVCDYI